TGAYVASFEGCARSVRPVACTAIIHMKIGAVQTNWAQLNEVIRNPGRVVRHSERTVGQVRIPTNDVRILMVEDVVLLFPRLFLHRGVPAEARGMELLGFLQAVPGAVQRGMANLDGLQLMMPPEREHAGEPGRWIHAEVNQRSADDFREP